MGHLGGVVADGCEADVAITPIIIMSTTMAKMTMTYGDDYDGRRQPLHAPLGPDQVPELVVDGTTVGCKGQFVAS